MIKNLCFLCHRQTSPITTQVYIFYITTLGVLMQVMFQGNNDVSPMFEKYKVIISIFIVVITIHVGAVIVGEIFRMWIGIIRVISLLFGFLAPILLLLILLPIFGWVLLGFWVLLLAKVAWDYKQQCHHLLSQLLVQALHKFDRLMNHIFTPQELPV